MPWSAQKPKRPFRFLAYLIVLAAFALFVRHLFSTPPSPPPVTQDWQKKTPPAPIPTITANNVSDPVNEEDYWPQWDTWGKDGWVMGSADLQQPFLSNLQTYKEQGHDRAGLTHLLDQPTNIHALAAVDVVIRVTDAKEIQPQLEAIVSQTIKPKTVWLVTSLPDPLDYYYPNARTIRIPPDEDSNDDNDSSSSSSFINTMGLPFSSLPLNEDIDWVWVLDQDTIPTSSRYLESMLRLMHSPPYQNALLGTHAVLLPSNFHNDGDDDNNNNNDAVVCLPDKHIPTVSQPADMVQGSWVLDKKWIHLLSKATPDEMQLPLAYAISHQLSKYGDIMTVALPFHPRLDLRVTSSSDMCQCVQQAYVKNDGWKRMRALRTSPSALDYRQATVRSIGYKLDTVMFVLDGPEQAAAFYPLMCRFGYTVHAVVSGAERGLSGSTLEKTLKDTGCGRRVVVHDLDVMVSAEEGTSATEVAMGIARLVRVLRPRALFHVLRDQPLSHALETMADNEKITAIGLPADDVVHALWISDLPLEALEQWHTPDINLVVITDRRPHSLSRLLQSAERSFYLGDKVNLVVHLEQSSDPVTRMLVNNFPWRHGKKILRHRMRKGGLMPAIIESWYPKHINDYAVILEDDVEVSPLFYVWSKYSILQYRYTHAVDDQLRRTMYGVSLYSPRSLELHPPGRRPFHPDNVLLNHYPPRMPYVSQVPCSWGAVYFPEHWREFHEYLTIRLMDMNQDKLLNVTVPQSRSARWKKSWKKYFIELVYLRAYVMLYPNFQEFESFSTNHLETGTHVKTTAKRLNSINAFLVPLMQRDTILAQLPNHRLPEYDDLPVLDLWGYLKTHDELDETAAQWHTRISTCPRTTGTFDPKDLLCPFPPPEEPVPEPPKKPKKIKTAYAVEPIEYVTMYYNTHGSQQAKEELVAIDHNNDDDLPGPINVARMPSAPDDGSNLWDDHWLDLLSELDLMNQLYTRMNPEDLRDVLAADAELDLD